MCGEGDKWRVDLWVGDLLVKAGCTSNEMESNLLGGRGGRGGA